MPLWSKQVVLSPCVCVKKTVEYGDVMEKCCAVPCSYVLLTTHKPNHETANPNHESLEKSHCLGHEWFCPGRHVKQMASQIIFLVLL